jgi:uncharacterized protein
MRGMLLALVSGLVFGIGLILSGMTRHAKVLIFLDPLSGWDPSLAFVMIGAISVHALAYRLVPRLQQPIYGSGWHLSTRRDIDLRRLFGAALFGAGCGLGG